MSKLYPVECFRLKEEHKEQVTQKATSGDLSKADIVDLTIMNVQDKAAISADVTNAEPQHLPGGVLNIA